MGYASTLTYVTAAAAAILHETGLLPHVNAGVMQLADVESLRLVSASQGLMLESTAPRLMLPGGAHFECPDKVAPRDAHSILNAHCCGWRQPRYHPNLNGGSSLMRALIFG